MDNQLRLHADNLSLFIEPTFKRQTIGYFSIDSRGEYQPDDSEKASLVALKEKEKTSQGVAEYEVPGYIEELDLNEGYETYNDSADEPAQKDLVSWLKKHQEECADVDIVCSEEAIAKIFRAPYTDPTATPWELKVTRGPDGICYLEEDERWRSRYSEMNTFAKKQYFRQKSFQKYMTIKKGVRSKCLPPSDHKNAFFRVNKLELDSGTIVYQSEIQCFDINYSAIDLRAQPQGQFDLPSPTTRLRWWSGSHLSGANLVMCGYYDNDENDLDHSIHRLMSFDLNHIKPRRIRDATFDEEICVGSLCTFVQFVKDLTISGAIRSFILRFEPGSKRVCILEPEQEATIAPQVPAFGTQISATDETSSVEATPRSPNEATDFFSTASNGSANMETIPRLRKFTRQDSSRPPVRRRNTLTTELGGQIEADEQPVDNDDDKYAKKLKSAEEDDPDWLQISIVLLVIVLCFVGIPWIIEAFGHISPY